jgi:CheY-like chemotaxis protein
MDCQMPVMDGQEATAQLRARERANGAMRTLVVALTADATIANRRRCQEAGMDRVVTKPISQSELREIVCHAVLARRQSAA